MERKIPLNQNDPGLIEDIGRYINDIDEILEDVNALSDKRTALFMDFDAEVPEFVQLDRTKRALEKTLSPGKKSAKKASRYNHLVQSVTNGIQETSMYLCISINSVYRPRIREIHGFWKAFLVRRKYVYEKYAALKAILDKQPKFKAYKPIKGD